MTRSLVYTLYMNYISLSNLLMFGYKQPSGHNMCQNTSSMNISSLYNYLRCEIYSYTGGYTWYHMQHLKNMYVTWLNILWFSKFIKVHSLSSQCERSSSLHFSSAVIVDSIPEFDRSLYLPFCLVDLTNTIYDFWKQAHKYGDCCLHQVGHAPKILKFGQEENRKKQNWGYETNF